MASAQQVAAKLGKTLDIAARCFEAELGEGYEALNEEVSELEALAREAFQAKLSDTFKPVLEKLKKGQSLTPDELKMLELLIVGDAEYYLRSENNIENWKAQVRSLIEQIRGIQASQLEDVDGLMRLRAICREALELLPHVAFYLEEKERVHKFQEATSQPLDPEAGQAIAEIIQEKLDSDQF
jgi:hypothetical protein